MKLLPLATWNEMRRQFVEGEGTIVNLCQKAGALPCTAYARARREGWTRLRREREKAQLAALVPSVPAVPEIPPTPENEMTQKLRRLESQLARLDDKLDTEEDAAKLDRLASAKTRLFGQWQILRGVPLPGSRHPAKERPKPQVTTQPISPIGSRQPVSLAEAAGTAAT